MGKLLLVLLGGLLLVAILISWRAWDVVGEDAQIGGHGILALVLGTVLAAALGGGLMTLVFLSSRHGYDDRADPEARKRDPKDWRG